MQIVTFDKNIYKEKVTCLFFIFLHSVGTLFRSVLIKKFKNFPVHGNALIRAGLSYIKF